MSEQFSEAVYLALLEYERYRKEIKKPLTEKAIELIFEKLATWQAQGQDPVEVLEQSIMNGWTGIWPVRKGGWNAKPTESFAERNIRRADEELSEVSRRAQQTLQKMGEGLSKPTIGREAVAVYLEALSDLSPDQIDAGCTNAIKTAEQFPKPGHIRSAVPFETSIFRGPPMLHYTETLSPEEREAAIKESAKFKAAIQKHFEPKKPTPPMKKILRPVATPHRSIEEQKAELRRKGLLK